jgi:hypothetical protein
MSVITNWNAENAGKFSKEVLEFKHELHLRPMFSDEGLEQLLDQYPRDRLGVFTMGHDPVDWTSWRRGTGGQLSGSKLLEAAQAGRIWLNLRNASGYLPAYSKLCDEIFADKEAHVPGLRTFKRDLGVLISSANAQVFYHLDVPLVSLWQIRGEKQVWVWPARDPFVGEDVLERIVLRETDEQFEFEPQWDQNATQVVLRPGNMVTWPQNGPHRIVNGPMMNVSLSIEFMTPPALLRANVIFANGILRRKLGAHPRIRDGVTPVNLAKLAIARGVKAVGMSKSFEKTLPVTFSLNENNPGTLQEVAADV